MRAAAKVLAVLGLLGVLASAIPAAAGDPSKAANWTPGPTPPVVADLWLRRIANDQNLDGDHTTYYVTVYRKQGPQGEEHRVVGPRPVGEWQFVNNKSVGPNISDRLVQAVFKGDTQYIVRITHGDGTTALPNDPDIDFALDAGDHVIAMVPEAMQCAATRDGQPGISLTGPAHTRLWITVERPGLLQPEVATC